MPKNIPIKGDDPAWKRAVDEQLANLQQQIVVLRQTIEYLKSRV